jgi:hypothetical protein
MTVSCVGGALSRNATKARLVIQQHRQNCSERNDIVAWICHLQNIAMIYATVH